MKYKKQSVQDFQVILARASTCPICGTRYEDRVCPDPACPSNLVAGQTGPLARRASTMNWVPQAWATVPDAQPHQYAPPVDTEQYPPQVDAGQYAPQVDPGQYAPQFAPYPYGPPLPGQAPKRIRAGRVVGIGVLALLLAAGSFVVLNRLTSGSGQGAAAAVQPTFPATWDPKVQPLVEYVQKARGLNFQHPVSINFLTPAQYSASVRQGPQTAKERDKARQDTEIFRAVGLVSGNFDLAATSNQMVAQGTLALYLPKPKRIDVRGTDLTPGLRVTLVHELTHALQDQYHDLSRIDKMASSGESLAFKTVFEGDAVRIEHLYVKSLPKAEQDAYAAEQTTQTTTAKADLKDVPTGLITMFEAPYSFGEEFLRALSSKGGNASVDDAFRKPPIDELQIFDPWVYLANQQPNKVSDPALKKGEKKFDSGDFGALSWFVVLSQRIDPHLALQAADAWAGDAYVSFRKDGRTCMRADIAAGSATGSDQMLSALSAWTQAMPSGAATVTRNGTGLELVTCDPGTSADLKPIATAETAMVYPLFRTDFTVGWLAQGGAVAPARCAATKVVASYGAAELGDPTGAAILTGPGAVKLRQIVASCRSAT